MKRSHSLSQYYMDYVMYHFDKITDFQKLQVEIEYLMHNDQFKSEVRKMLTDSQSDQPGRDKDLFDENKKRLPGYSPVRAMIDGIIPLKYVSKRARLYSPQKRRLLNEIIIQLNEHHNVKWRPKSMDPIPQELPLLEEQRVNFYNEPEKKQQ